MIKVIISIICYITIQTYCATIAQIESFKIGPNPFIIGSSDLIVNFVSSTEISSEYYLYASTGELILTKSYALGSTSSQSGTNQFIIATANELSTIAPGLYILYSIYTYNDTVINEKAYIIAK